MSDDLSPQLGGTTETTGREPELSGARPPALPQPKPEITIRLTAAFDAREVPDLKLGDTARFKAMERPGVWYQFKGIIDKLSTTFNYELVTMSLTLVDAENTVSNTEPSDSDAINISGNLQSAEHLAALPFLKSEWDGSVMPWGLSSRPTTPVDPREPVDEYPEDYDPWGYEEYEDDE